MLTIYWGMAAFLIAFSWVRSKNILHPHFMFTSMLIILLSDFLIRGNGSSVISYIPEQSLANYQASTAFVITAIVVGAAAIRRPIERGIFRHRPHDGRFLKHGHASRSASSTETANQKLLIFAGAAGVAAFEVIKRLYSTEYDLELVLDQMLGPRGVRNWDVLGEGNSDNAFFQLIRSVLPFSAVACAYLIVRGGGALKILSSALLAVVLFILVTDGSRTSVVLPIAALVVFSFLYARSLALRLVTLIGGIVAIAFLTSLMYRYRASGFVNSSDINSQLVYHQDDSIYRVWQTYHFADISSYRWDFWEWYQAILFQPIPRLLWPAKPELGPEFYGGFKLPFVTNSFMGESVALLGTVFGSVWSVIVALFLYYGFYRSITLLRHPFGTPVYLIIALYVYMIIRSTMNLTTFVFLPAATLLAFWLLNRRQFADRERFRKEAVFEPRVFRRRPNPTVRG